MLFLITADMRWISNSCCCGTYLTTPRAVGGRPRTYESVSSGDIEYWNEMKMEINSEAVSFLRDH